MWIEVTGHIVKAMGEPEAMRSMRSGWVPLSWARAHRPRWHAAAVAHQGADDGEDAPAGDGATPLSQR